MTETTWHPDYDNIRPVLHHLPPRQQRFWFVNATQTEVISVKKANELPDFLRSTDSTANWAELHAVSV